MPRFDPFVLFLFLQHRAQIRSLRFVLGSPASRSDSIPSFCFRFSSIAPEFYPFLLFWVLRHRAQIQSLCFVSGSPTSCSDSIPSFFFSSSPASFLDSIPSFCFGLSCIVPGFNPFLLFWVLRHHTRILLYFPESCLDFPHLPRHCVRASLIFSGIVSDFHYLFRHRDLIFLIFLGMVSEHRLSFSASRPAFSYLHLHCVRITHLPRHRAWISLSPSIVATQFRQPSVLGKGTKLLVIWVLH